MWFSPQKELGNDRFFTTILFSCIGHALLVLVFFLVDKFGLQASQSVMSLHKGAQVKLFSHGAKPGTGSKNQGINQGIREQKSAEPEKRTEHLEEKKKEQPLVNVSSKKEELAQAPAKPTPEKQASAKQAPVKQVPAKQVSVKQGPARQVPARQVPARQASGKKEVKEVTKKTSVAAPQFSELKKSYTNLKRKKNEQYNKKPQDIKAAIVPNAVQKKGQQSTQQKAEETKGSGSGYASGSSASPVEFDANEGLWSSDVVIQELAKHYNVPPGFEIHEAISISIDIEEGKVVSLSPQGKESLVLYTAIKEALLHSNFPIKRLKNKIIIFK